ncbi:O-antigen translocase [Flavicella sediminum]|uniref:O-antigen translocase n=1 Tax=Flavicella sediminum TaxID=2585141 RepID=UPI00111FA935|nr:O-antigen translocase [Flavicella sediminum]
MFNFYKKNQLFKVISYNSLSVIVKFISGFISMKVIAHFLGSEGMVYLGNFKNFNTTNKTFSTLGFDTGVTKLIAEHKEDQNEINKIITTALISSIGISLLISIILVLFTNYFNTLLFDAFNFKFVLYSLALFLPLYSINNLLVAVINGFQKFKSLINLNIFVSLFGLVLSVLFIWKHLLAGALFGIAVIESFAIGISFYYFKKLKIPFQFKLHYFSKNKLQILLLFSIMTLASALIVPSSHFYIRNLIADTIDLNAAGYWEAMTRISNYYMLVISSGISMYYLPKLASINSDDDLKKELTNYYKTLVPPFLFIVGLLFIFRKPIVLLLLNQEFLPVTELFIWQIIGDIFKVLSLAFGYQLLAKTMIKTYLFVEVIFYIVFIILSVFWLQKFALNGVLMAYAAANFLNFILMIVLFRKKWMTKKNIK